MKENKYDETAFFEKYSRMARSQEGLQAAGEWHELRKLFPDFREKRVLDLGCGFGWHCRYAVEQGAESVIGIDISEKMLEEARKKTESPRIIYLHSPLEDFKYEPERFDVVLSSLVFHYIASFSDLCRKIYRCLTSGGDFIFSVEHPIFTACSAQDWCYDSQGRRQHWPVDAYFSEGIRKTTFLGEKVIKYHRTLTALITTLLASGFELKSLVEPKPERSLLHNNPEMQDELRRPMMLLIAARKRIKELPPFFVKDLPNKNG